MNFPDGLIQSKYAEIQDKSLSIKDCMLCYDAAISKDNIFPLTVKEMNAALLEARQKMGKIIIQ